MKPTQTAAIRAQLERGESITPLQALSLYGCFRLAARIFDLKAEGLTIDSNTITINGHEFAEYFLIP